MENKYIELSQLQQHIKSRINGIQAWVRAEIGSCKCSKGHWYLDLIEKAPGGGAELAKAKAIIWRSSASIIDSFRRVTGKVPEAGMTVVINASVNYDARYGLSLIVADIDASYTLGQRERQKQETIRSLEESGLMRRQKSLALPFIPSDIALVTSSGAAGYGDFLKQVEQNPNGFRFNFTLYDSVMQGDNAPASIIGSLRRIGDSGRHDLVLIMRGGGADFDMFCFDDRMLCEAIALCPVPVLTAIGHERDFHIADMVARGHVKTPTALAEGLIKWVADREAAWMETVGEIGRALTQMTLQGERTIGKILTGIRYYLSGNASALGTETGRILSAIRNGLSDGARKAAEETARTLSTIRIIIGAETGKMESDVKLLENSIAQADPRSILAQGYVLAAGPDGKVLRSARSGKPGDRFSLRFRDGMWKCGVEETLLSQKNG